MNKIEFGDCRETMRRWAQEGVKVQTCVTSPPYYGLRDYGHEGQIGLEETPDDYIVAMVEVFRCVRDVLADDGTLWLNIGDSYAGSWGNAGGQNRGNGTQRAITVGSVVKDQAERNGLFVPPGAQGFKNAGIKPKDLIGIPWMLAFALRTDGWYLRQDIIWHKPNPMPESVQDRCTKAHEYIFLLSKSPKYYYDIEAIKEPVENMGKPRKFRDGDPNATLRNDDGRIYIPKEDRNKRSVWTVNTKPYEGAHFAVFPSDLIEPCILAGAPVGGIVLDPFMGSGTTAQVAQNLGRQYMGCELNPEYKALQDKRLSQMSLELS